MKTGNGFQQTSTSSRWLSMVDADLPIDPGTMFPSTKRFFADRANSRRVKLLTNLRPLLLKALEGGERILYVARGVQNVWVEQIFSGHLAAHYANQVALVLTDRRVLLVYVNHKGEPRDIKNQLRWEEIVWARRKSGLGRYLQFRLADRKKLLFQGLTQEDCQTFHAAFPRRERDTRSARPSLEHLCPACLKVVAGQAGDVASCPHCRIPFRGAERAARLSLLVPGVGDIYLRQFGFGTLEFIGSLLASGLGIYMILVALLGPTTEQLLSTGLLGALLLMGPRAIDYFVTRHMARKGLVPLSLEPPSVGVPPAIEPGPSSNAALPSFPRWAYGLFAVGAMACVLTVAALVPVARTEAALALARDEARHGQFDAALARWETSEAFGYVDNDDRGRLALALYEAGDLEGGDLLIARIGENGVGPSLAQDINDFLERLRQAAADYDAGLKALSEGDEAAAWPAIEKALSFYRGIKRPRVPHTRDAVLADFATFSLSAPLYQQDYEIATRILARIGPEASRAVVDVARARVFAVEGELEDAARLLGTVPVDALPPSSALLALETRVAMARSDETIREVAEVAANVSPEGLSDHDSARRAALAALAGTAFTVSPDVAERAAQIAEAERWTEAAARLRLMTQLGSGVPAGSAPNGSPSARTN